MLARQLNREIVFLTHLPRGIAFQNPHMFEILAGAESALAAKGYALKLRGATADTVCALSTELMEGKHADGLLLHLQLQFIAQSPKHHLENDIYRHHPVLDQLSDQMYRPGTA